MIAKAFDDVSTMNHVEMKNRNKQVTIDDKVTDSFIVVNGVLKNFR